MEALLKGVKVENERIGYMSANCLPPSDKEAHPSTLRGLRRASLHTCTAQAQVSRSPQPLIEPLSQRELEVLRLMAQGLTNREIPRATIPLLEHG